MNSTKIIKKVEISTFRDPISDHELVIGAHTLDHLSNAQRKIFDHENLLRPLLKETPAGIGLQRNGRYAAFFTRNKYYLKVILSVYDTKMEIITFINTETMPNMERI